MPNHKRQLRSAALTDEPVKNVRAQMTEAFRDPEAIRAAMPEYESDDEILFEHGSLLKKGAVTNGSCSNCANDFHLSSTTSILNW